MKNYAQQFKRKLFFEKMLKMWLKVLDLIENLCILVTFFMIPVLLGHIVYFTVLCYSPFRALVYCIVTLFMIHTNVKLGGR